jgi:hypothetical protein
MENNEKRRTRQTHTTSLEVSFMRVRIGFGIKLYSPPPTTTTMDAEKL